MADYTALGSQTATIQSKIDALAGSTLTATDLLYLSEALVLLGTSLGVNDVVGATNAAVASLNVAKGSIISVVNGTANGSAVTSLTSQYSVNNTLLNNLIPRVTSLEASSSSQNSAIATASAQAAAASYNAWKIVNTTGSTLAVAKDRIFVVPVTGLIITLPAGPNLGDEILIVDAAGTAGTTNFTVARNGSLIMGTSTDLIFNVSNKSVRLVYSNATYGWRMV
jgi:hypothetical protein